MALMPFLVIYHFLKRIHPSRKTLIGIRNVTSDHRFPNPFWGDFVLDGDNYKLVAMSASAQYFDFYRCFPWVKEIFVNL